jgi:prepilin-type N-terminal cleavage/methylation domain-containing protein
MKSQLQNFESHRPISRDGFTLIEVVVAMVVLTFGVLGLAGSTMYLVNQVSVADLATERVAVVQSVVESLRAQPFDTVSSGIDSIGVFSVEWRSWVEGSRSKGIEIVSTGPGLVTTSDGPRILSAVADTFYYQVVRP